MSHLPGNYMSNVTPLGGERRLPKGYTHISESIIQIVVSKVGEDPTTIFLTNYTMHLLAHAGAI